MLFSQPSLLGRDDRLAWSNFKSNIRRKIGAGNSVLHNYVKFPKVLRMHAIFHDAHGFMGSVNNVKPGYVYSLTTEKHFRNSLFLGHFSEFYFGCWWKFSLLKISINFVFDSSKVFLLRNGRLFQLKQSVLKIFVLIAMNDAESTRSSCYYIELRLKQEQQAVDEPDFAKISQCNIGRLVFDENQERPRLVWTFLRWQYKTRSAFACNFDSLISYFHSWYFLYNVSYALWGRQQVSIRHVSAFVSLPGPYFTDAKSTNKGISTQPHCFVSVVGPAGSGNTRMTGRMISNREKFFHPALAKSSTL